MKSYSEELKTKLSELEGEYIDLSRAAEFFTRTSKHVTAIPLVNRMGEILNEIELIKR
jgi:hypothetical protein